MQIVAIDVTRESYDEIGAPVVEKAGMAHKVDFRVGLALPALDQLVAEVRAPRVPLPPPVLALLCCRCEPAR